MHRIEIYPFFSLHQIAEDLPSLCARARASVCVCAYEREEPNSRWKTRLPLGPSGPLDLLTGSGNVPSSTSAD